MKKRANVDRSTLAARLAAIIESTDDAIIGESLDGIIESWNPAAERLFGWKADEVVGCQISLILPDERSGEQAELRGAVGRGESVDHFETVRARKDGSRLDVSVTVSPIRDPQGNIVGLSKIVRDVTEQKRLVAQAREVQEGAARLKSEFLAAVTHELRTPLNAIVGWLQLFRDDALDEGKRKTALAAMERNAAAQLRLIDDLLDASQGASGTLLLQPVPVDLIQVAEQAIEIMRPAAMAKRLTVQTRWKVPTLVVPADPDRLQQVVWNLVSNAIKFSDAGGSVTVAAETTSDDRARLTVSDTGCGIAPEFLPHVFDHFRQQDGSQTRVHGGLGLGLSIVRHIVELHGGSVQAESAGTGRGATFTITLPRVNVSRE
ncbi:MAG: ATP-binding protein [Gemmatimonadaceae bacterium]